MRTIRNEREHTGLTVQTKPESGILLHPTSLPSDFGIGDIGLNARTFVDKLANAHQRWWQMLPLTPPDPTGSPYASTSAFASNPALIDPVDLHRRGWLTKTQLDDARLPSTTHTDIAAASRAKMALLELAFGTWQKTKQTEDFYAFCQREQRWLDDYAFFAALRDDHHQASWTTWPRALVKRDPAALKKAHHKLRDRIEFYKFTQWIFDEQWSALRSYAHQHNVKLIGDIPIFVAMDSADVWARRDLFLLDHDGQPSVVAGVPPDYFSKTGQKWGNPLYDWRAIEQDQYDWWIARVERATQLVDLVRIDHFRGFEAYWEVPADAPTAETGQWIKGPGDDFFNALKDRLGDVPFIAEDLGLITQGVHDLRDRHNLPGMKVMHFAFGNYENEPDHMFLPHTYPTNCVAYAGTHDNDTTRGWFDALDDRTQHFVRVYLSSSNEEIVDKLMERLLSSKASLVILTTQDIYGLPATARMNTPATVTGNWNWRLTPKQLKTEEPWSRLAELTQTHRGES